MTNKTAKLLVNGGSQALRLPAEFRFDGLDEVYIRRDTVNLYRFGYVLGKFGITSRGLGVTAHGLRHEALIEEFVVRTGQQPPVRGGGKLAPEVEKAARQAVAKLAGHARKRASNAYLGAVMFRKAGREKNGPTE